MGDVSPAAEAGGGEGTEGAARAAPHQKERADESMSFTSGGCSNGMFCGGGEAAPTRRRLSLAAS